MHKRLVSWCVIAAAVAASVILPGQADAVRHTASSNVSVNFIQGPVIPPDFPDLFVGQVSSMAFQCIANRTVDLYQVRRGRKPKRVGTAPTDFIGGWAIAREDPGNGKKFFAKVRAVDVAILPTDDNICLAAKSSRVKVTGETALN